MKLKRIAKKMILGALMGALILMCTGCGKERIYKIEDATSAALNMGAGWSLGNTLDAFNSSIVSRVPSASETCWGNPVATKDLIKAISQAGFKTVRIPVTWKGHLDEDDNIDEAWLDRVQEIVDYCYDYKLYVILNMHHDTGADEKQVWIRADVDSYNKGIQRFKKIWTQVAERFSGYDGHLLFEGYNEILDQNSNWNNPGQKASYDIVNKWAQVFVDTIRAAGGNNANRNLIVSPYAASYQMQSITEMVMPSDTVENHLLVEVHMYSPYEFCDSEAGVVEKHVKFTSEYENYIQKSFDGIKATFTDKGIPVVVGEFAATNKNNTSERVKYAECYVKHCREIGAAYIWWDNGLKKDMGLFSRSTYECWFPEIVEKIVK